MCGIVAVCTLHSAPTSGDSGQGSLAENLQAAIQKIKYRGPDGSGVWTSDKELVGLGHCRLTINDLSDAGLQPMHYNGVHAVVNGEIYDYGNLRQEFGGAGFKFSSTSDSELVIAAYRIHGVPGMFRKLRGEFAFVLYDEANAKVIAGRDRYGIKPLVWTTVGDRVIFASEAKAFLPLGWQPEWDVHAITDCGWMCDNRTIFKGVQKLLPGHWAEVDKSGLQIHRYWDLEYPDKSLIEGAIQRLKECRNVDDMVMEVRRRFVEAVRVRMKADVPVGVYLSGGIDSSAVAGVMAHLAKTESIGVGSQKTGNVSCFTIQFPDQFTHNESAIAERTAESLGVKIFKKYVDEQVLADGFEETSYHSEHHIFDMNTVAKHALSEVVREQGVKVVLTGEGADEHFAGYSFTLSQFLQEPDLSMPDLGLSRDNALRETLHRSMEDEAARVWETQGADLQETLHNKSPKSSLPINPWSIFAVQPAVTLFSSWVLDQYNGQWDRRETMEAACAPDVLKKMQDKWHPGHTMLYIVIKSVLQNLILAGLGDRTEMAHGVEGRPPVLDHHLTEYVNMLPPSIKSKYTPPGEDSLDDIGGFWWKPAGSGIRSQTEKWVMREAVRPFVTDELYRRRKQPFLCPATWPADGPLHKMFQRILTREAVEELGFVDYAAVQRAMDTAFGPEASPTAIRVLGFVGAWVTIGRRFGVKKATVGESGWKLTESLPV